MYTYGLYQNSAAFRFLLLIDCGLWSNINQILQLWSSAISAIYASSIQGISPFVKTEVAIAIPIVI